MEATNTKNGMVQVNIACRWCGKKFTLWVPLSGLTAWREGELIQNALPKLTRDERELFISQTCPLCWKETFGDL